MKSLRNKIIVTIEKKFQDTITFESGVTLYKDPTWEPEQNVTTYGTVVAVPDVVNKDAEEFYENVQVGDKLYFNYLTVIDEERTFEVDGQDYYYVEYYDAIAIVRDGVIKPVGQFILIEPIKEELASDYLIIPELAQKEGNKGRVFASNCEDIPEGAIVHYEEIGKYQEVIEGKKVYCPYISNILFIYERD